MIFSLHQMILRKKLHCQIFHNNEANINLFLKELYFLENKYSTPQDTSNAALNPPSK